ncbi:heparinase II/III family protein [Rhodocaloribacter litoris]|uniref:heparinase II/III family protein n=1 Tax=Rhodocaloribacter litoris TaxID=2558931 RepID=UPI0014221BA4|nr:heparinase II/III family protein [Rhodocaloribacter litoris]QXD16167.1 heparinase II/III family protein [Rhodocaloribacter litoris]
MKSPDEWMRFWRTVWHHRPEQLWARLHLMLRRHWRVRHAERYRRRLLEAPVPELILREPLPRPLFAPRTQLAREEADRVVLTFLNESRTFQLPFDWRPKELQYGTRLWLLNLHYMEFLEALSDETCRAVIDDWIERVLPYQEKYWLDNWNSYALSIRCVVWMQQYAVRWTRWPESFRKRMLISLYVQQRFLYENIELDIGGNHLIKNIKALLWAGRFWNLREADKWYEKGAELLRSEVARQILPDGMHYERSPAYHAQVFADLIECYYVLKEGELKKHLGSVLDQMAQVLVDLTHPDGKVSLFNDGGLNMAFAPDESLRVWQNLGGRGKTPRRSFALKEAGYYGFRDGNFVLVDCGIIAPEELPAHGHGDILSFEWTIGGKRIIVDTGVYEYNPGERRHYSRSTKAHNTVTIDGKDQCEFWGAFRVGRLARVRCIKYEERNGGFILVGEHDGYRYLLGRPVHRRRYEVSPQKIVVRDQIHGGAGQDVEARLLLHPGCRVEQQADTWLIRREDVDVCLETDAEVELVTAEWFPDFGEAHPCTQIVMRYPPAPCEGGFSLERLSE